MQVGDDVAPGGEVDTGGGEGLRLPAGVQTKPGAGVQLGVGFGVGVCVGWAVAVGVGVGAADCSPLTWSHRANPLKFGVGSGWGAIVANSFSMKVCQIAAGHSPP